MPESTASAKAPSRVDHVYDWLVVQMLSRKLVPGDSIHRREIAKKLQMSVSPVGEAMLQLESEGLLQTIPRVGTRIRIPSGRDVWGAVMARIAIECQAARILSVKSVPLAELVPLADRADQAPVASLELLHADAAFHRALVECADCPALLGLFDRVIRQSLLFISLENLPPRPRRNHRLLLKSLQTAGLDEAEAAVRRHIQSGKWKFASEQAWPEMDSSSSAPRTTSLRIHRSMNWVTDR